MAVGQNPTFAESSSSFHKRDNVVLWYGWLWASGPAALVVDRVEDDDSSCSRGVLLLGLEVSQVPGGRCEG